MNFEFMILLLYCIIWQIQARFDEEMLWGTYKPQLLHGISQRNMQTFNPLTVAFMYYNPTDLLSEQSIIYKVPELDTENIKIKIKHHNGRDFNVQEITDPFRECQFRNTWIKFPLDSKLNWVDETSTLYNRKPLVLIYAFSIEQFNPFELESRTFSHVIKEKGILITVGKDAFFVSMTLNNTQVNPLNSTQVTVLSIWQEYKDNWDPRRVIFKNLRDGETSSSANKASVMAVKFMVPANLSFTIQVVQSDRYRLEFPFSGLAQMADSLGNLNRFRFKQKFATADSCAYGSFTNLMQGLQFTFGNLDCEVERENCKEHLPMLTHTPSRLGFPRPFLWDEGFHNMVACKMNPDICLQSLTDWVNTMSSDGWIPREQPRNEELRSYIPGLKENPKESNPPTFFFDFSYLLDQNYQIQKIKILYPKLKLWYSSWFNTQAVFEGKQFTGFLKWWGPNEESNLGSGMDDWPRSSGSYYSKYNIDAQAWGYSFCEQMIKLANLFDLDFVGELENRMRLIKTKMNEVMLDAQDGLYKDILQEKKAQDGEQSQPSQLYFSPHRGYPNLLPLALGMLDRNQAEVIRQHLLFMRDEKTIWTPYGLRSLELGNPYFGVDSNYWRGPIWINMQFLVLRGLRLYYWDVQGVSQFYSELRENVIRNVCAQYETRGYFYEHYNQKLNGKGGGNRPFNGWTSLITLIIAEQY